MKRKYKKRMAAGMHTDDFRPLRGIPASRTWAEVRDVIRACGSPEMAAMDSRITSDEYVMATERKLQH
jgi:hypothetical protein